MGIRACLRLALCLIALTATQEPVTAMPSYPTTAVHLATTPTLTEIWSYDPREWQGAELGWSVGSAGNINADAWTDVYVSAPGASTTTATNIGLVYVFYGTGGVPNGTPNTVLTAGTGEAARGSRFGEAVATVGDVDGDGIDDLMVGASSYNFRTEKSKAGGAFVFSGSPTGLNVVPDWSEFGEAANTYFGASVASAGDVNGDGISDAIVGAPGYRGVGAAYVYFGSVSGLVTETAHVVSGTSASGYGRAVAGLGDVDKDGYDDVVVGAPLYDRDRLNPDDNAGAVLLYNGSEGGIGLTATWMLTGDHTGAQFGTAVAGIGDVNGDGYPDLAIGAPGYDADLLDTEANAHGLVQVYYGGEDGLGNTPDWSYVGPEAKSRLGVSLSGGDVNGDGYADLAVGMPSIWNPDGGSTVDAPEAVLVFLGSATGLARFPAWRLAAVQTTTDYGFSVGIVSDLQANAYADVLVGAPHYQRQDKKPFGMAFLYAGGESSPRVVLLPLILRSAP